MRYATVAVAFTAAIVTWIPSVYGEGNPVLGPVPKACETPGPQVIANSPLPNVAAALKERKKVTILAIGSTSASLRGPV